LGNGHIVKKNATKFKQIKHALNETLMPGADVMIKKIFLPILG
jgi:hypothetical protein